MKRLVYLTLFAAVVALASPQSAAAIAFTFAPASQSANINNGPLSVDIIVSGLSGSQIGDYDLDVSFNPSILSPTNVLFGPYLGAPSDSINGFSFTPGVVDLFEVSFLDPATLAALQPDSFTLATLVFSPLQLGTSPLTFSQLIAGDADGNPLSVQAGTGSATVTPEPGSLLLLGSGLLAAVIRRRRAG